MGFNLGFGDSFLVRELLFEKKGLIIHSFQNDVFNYDNEREKEALLTHVRQILTQLVKVSPRYIGLCHGATGGITAAIRALNPAVVSYGKHFFPFYPEMAKVALSGTGNGVMHLIDTPSNPEGIMTSYTPDPQMTVFDAAYHNPIYIPDSEQRLYPDHRVIVGSLGKIFGANGVRLGFFGTDDEVLFKTMSRAVTAETLGLSMTGVSLMNGILEDLDLTGFAKEASRRLDDNREELTKLSKLFSGSVPNTGMFYFPVADEKVRYLLKGVGVTFIEGEHCGSLDGHLRLSLGQTREITRDAVKAILAKDRL